MSATDNGAYSSVGKLMANYGWVQNTSNLSTVRDTVELVSKDGMNHNALMRAIFEHRTELGDIKKKWTWDARCRIKAICACGMVELDRDLQGYRLTPLGQELCDAPKSSVLYRGKRILSAEEKVIFRKGWPGGKFCVSVFRQNQEYHIINVHDWGLFPLATAFPGGWDGMRAETA